MGFLTAVKQRAKLTIAAPARRKALDAADAEGLAPEIGHPLRFLVDGKLRPADQEVRERVEHLRAHLVARSAEQASTARGRTSDLKQFATRQSVDPRNGTLLYLLAKNRDAAAILEFGACVGISGAYLASAGAERFVSMEGGDLADVARETVKAVNVKADVVHGLFDDLLPDVLSRFTAGLDLVWIDGNHHRDPTIAYFEAVKPKLNPRALVLFDDISWSDEMAEAWGKLKVEPGFTQTVTMGRIGMGLWSGGSASAPKHWDLSSLG